MTQQHRRLVDQHGIVHILGSDSDHSHDDVVMCQGRTVYWFILRQVDIASAARKIHYAENDDTPTCVHCVVRP